MGTSSHFLWDLRDDGLWPGLEHDLLPDDGLDAVPGLILRVLFALFDRHERLRHVDHLPVQYVVPDDEHGRAALPRVVEVADELARHVGLAHAGLKVALKNYALFGVLQSDMESFLVPASL